ncbi:MAG: hypothetical protein V4615_14130, partial [Bacteroidota bacterium]
AITDSGSLVTLFLTSYGDPRAAIVTRSNAKTQADLVLNDIMDNLLAKQLDKMANTLRFTNPSWWNQYHLSREILDLGTTFTKLRANCVDVNGNPLKDIVVSLFQNGVFIRSKKTDIEGLVSMVKIKPGNYDIKFEKEGLTTQIIFDYHFAPGSEKIHHITMLAGGGSTITIIREGDIPSPGQVPINLIGVNGTPASMVTIEVTGPAGVRFGAVANEIDPPGPIHFDKETGSITMTLDMFIELCGFGPGLNILVAQNIGMVLTHYKLTFTNLEP